MRHSIGGPPRPPRGAIAPIVSIALIAFVVLVGLLVAGLRRESGETHAPPSPLVGRPAPDFSLPRLDSGGNFSPRALHGKVWLLNVWASWCSACRQELPVLMEMRSQRALTLVGLNYKEARGDAADAANELSPAAETALAAARARDWLQAHGDPYALSALDLDGRVGIDYGVVGVPETYVIDKAGVIRFKYAGPLTPEILADKILPLVGELSR